MDAPRTQVAQHHLKILTALFLLSIVLLGRANRGTITEYGFGDDDDYWAYGRSFVYNGNIDFTREPLPTFVHDPHRKNYHAFVPSLMWLPAIVLGRALGPVIHRYEAPDAAGWDTGTSSWHRLLVSAFSATLAYIGLIGTYVFLSKFFDSSLAFQGAMISLWGTPLMFYVWRRPLMAHSSEYVLLVGGALSFYEYLKRPTIRMALLSSFLLSLAVLVRYPNVIMVSAIIAGSLWQWGWRGFKPAQGSALLVGLGIPVILQVIIWHSIYGSYFPIMHHYATSQKNVSDLFLLSGFTLKGMKSVLAGIDWGILWLEPACIGAFLGTLLLRKPIPRLRILLFIAMLMHLVIAANFGSQGGSYGYRYMLVMTLWLSINFVLCLSCLQTPRLRWGITAFCCTASIVPLLLYATGPTELTLHLGPSRVPGFTDWVNDAFLLNAWKTACSHPIQILYGLSGAPLVHGFMVLIMRWVPLSFLPVDAYQKFLARMTGVPLTDLGWFVGWEILFVGLFYAFFMAHMTSIEDRKI
jgi:hypothetical protein